MRTRDILFNLGLAVIISIPIGIGAYKSQAHGPVEQSVRYAEIVSHEAQVLTETAETVQMVQLSITHTSMAETVTDEATEVCAEETSGEDEWFVTPFAPYRFIPLDDEFQEYIHGVCDDYQIAYDLVLAVMKTESEFDDAVIGDRGEAVGLMQIQPRWWQEKADSLGLDIHDNCGNVKLGIIILTEALDRNGGDLNKALKEYNAGTAEYPGNEYIDRVFENYGWILDQKEAL